MLIASRLALPTYFWFVEHSQSRRASEQKKREKNNAKPELFCIQQCNDESVHKVREHLAAMVFVGSCGIFGTFYDFSVDFSLTNEKTTILSHTQFYAYGSDGRDRARKMTVTTRTPMNIRIRLWAHSFATCYDFKSELLCISLSKLLQPLRRQSVGRWVAHSVDFCHSTFLCDKFTRDSLFCKMPT